MEVLDGTVVRNRRTCGVIWAWGPVSLLSTDNVPTQLDRRIGLTTCPKYRLNVPCHIFELKILNFSLQVLLGGVIKNLICKSKAVRISKYGVNVLGVCGVVDKSRNRDGRGGNLRSSILILVFDTSVIDKRTCTSPAHTDKYLLLVISMTARSARVKSQTIRPSI